MARWRIVGSPRLALWFLLTLAGGGTLACRDRTDGATPAQSAVTWKGPDAAYWLSEAGVQQRVPLKLTPAQLRGLELDDTGTWLAVARGDGIGVHDLEGRLVANVSSSALGRKHRFWRNRLLVPLVDSADPHRQRVLGFDAVDVRTSGRLRLDVPDARFTRPSGTSLIVVSSAAVSRWDQTGRLVWRRDGGAHELVSARNADRQLLTDRADARRAIHLAAGQEVSRVEFRSPIWNLALDSDGKHSALTTERNLHVFINGRLQRSSALELRYATALLISTKGDVLVGGHDEAGEALALLVGADGVLRQRWSLGEAANGFTPNLSLLGGGRFAATVGARMYLGRFEPAELVLSPLGAPEK